jgi:transporter family protein
MNWLVAIAIGCWAIWSIAAKMASNHMHPLWIQTINYIIGFLCIPILLLVVKRDTASHFDSAGIWWAIVASVCGIAAYAAFTFALRIGNVGTTTILCSTYPILTLVLSAIFLGETITLPKLIGMFMVLGGMVLVAR